MKLGETTIFLAPFYPIKRLRESTFLKTFHFILFDRKRLQRVSKAAGEVLPNGAL